MTEGSSPQSRIQAREQHSHLRSHTVYSQTNGGRSLLEPRAWQTSTHHCHSQVFFLAPSASTKQSYIFYYDMVINTKSTSLSKEKQPQS